LKFLLLLNGEGEADAHSPLSEINPIAVKGCSEIGGNVYERHKGKDERLG
jgi:hypothetical protein